ncbi:hypothetical protein CDAR_601061 [Caerostris darwini]|uniref:C2H2-type domain-containing protein n=1 Tax=Caerostris darwini TaxID=1538125 RepID=A0AAV4VUE1_9ARAC|nr:hypothetical protein CDAR_601061 [Caerostris darwini]
MNDFFASESDTQLFPNYDFLLGKNYVFDSEEGQSITQVSLPAIESTAQPNFSCEFCAKSFNRRRYLLDHLNIHTGKRPYVCKFCSKNFTQRASCNRHMKLCHPELVLISKSSSDMIINSLSKH